MPSTKGTARDLHFKAMPGQMAVDEVQGIVECFVAAIGNKDSVGDIIVPGAFDSSFKKRKPRVVWGHDWNQPIGKVLDIYEVGPRDSRLPAKMKQAGVGGVFAKVQFNLNSERGREAFSNVLFFGEEQEWSIGYKTLDAVWDPNTQANVLRELELYEVSPVLHGANQLTGTISIKDATGGEDDTVTSLRDSKWGTFDIAWAKKLKEEHPDIWAKGGNIKGNDQWRILTQIAEKGKATTQAELNALKLREAWIARHKDDFQLPGVIAQIKWLAVGSRGEKHMKDVVREAIAKKNEKGYWDDEIEHKSDGVRKGSLVRWDSSGGTAYGKVVEVAERGTVSARPNGPTMRGSADDPAVGVQVWKFANGRWTATDTVTVHRTGSLRVIDSLPESKAAPSLSDIDVISDAVGLDPLPQERVTGDVLRGYGPRRGNLEKLLRYWRPIMRKPGGFRRCRVILADHPELYPLENLCAWLHHETTGLWPNEGCHHPGMKNCRKKVSRLFDGKPIRQGSVLSDSDFERRLRNLKKDAKCGCGSCGGGMQDDMTRFAGALTGTWDGRDRDDDWDMDGDDDWDWDMDGDGPDPYADEEELLAEFGKAIAEYLMDNPDLLEFLHDDDNWVHEGEDEDGNWYAHDLVKEAEQEMEDPIELLVKAGRILSGRNQTRLVDALKLIKAVIDEAGGGTDMAVKGIGLRTADPYALADDLAPIIAHHGIEATVSDGLISFKAHTVDGAASDAIRRAVDALGYEVKAFGFGGDRFDPNAEDGDEDGTVQDGTPFARPALPGQVAEAVADAASGAGKVKDPVFRPGDWDGVAKRNAAEKRLSDEYNTIDTATHRSADKRGPLPSRLTPLAPFQKRVSNETYDERAEKAWADATPEEIRSAQLWSALSTLRKPQMRQPGETDEGYAARRGKHYDARLEEYRSGKIDLEAALADFERSKDHYVHVMGTGNPDRMDVDKIAKLIRKVDNGDGTPKDMEKLKYWRVLPFLAERELTDAEKRRNVVYAATQLSVPEAVEYVMRENHGVTDRDKIAEITATVQRARDGQGIGYAGPTLEKYGLDPIAYPKESTLPKEGLRYIESDGWAMPGTLQAMLNGASITLESGKVTDYVVDNLDFADSKLREYEDWAAANPDWHEPEVYSYIEKLRKQIDAMRNKPEVKAKAEELAANRKEHARRVEEIRSDPEGVLGRHLEAVAAWEPDGEPVSPDDYLRTYDEDDEEGREGTHFSDLPWGSIVTDADGNVGVVVYDYGEDSVGVHWVKGPSKHQELFEDGWVQTEELFVDDFIGEKPKYTVYEEIDDSGSVPYVANITSGFSNKARSAFTKAEREQDPSAIYELKGKIPDSMYQNLLKRWNDTVADLPDTGVDSMSGEKLAFVEPKDWKSLSPEALEASVQHATDVAKAGLQEVQKQVMAAEKLLRDGDAAGANKLTQEAWRSGSRLLGAIHYAEDQSLIDWWHRLTQGRVGDLLEGTRKAKSAGHAWLSPVVRHHGIPYTVKSGEYTYDVSLASPEAIAALDNAIGSMGATGGMSTKRDYGTDTRSEYAGKGWALPDGSFPIRDKGDLDNAIKAYGRAKDRPRAKAHIVKRARQLGATGMLPDGWA